MGGIVEFVLGGILAAEIIADAPDRKGHMVHTMLGEDGVKLLKRFFHLVIWSFGCNLWV